MKGRERRSKPVSFSLLEKERFLESKEKGAPKRVRRLQIGIRRPVFTPPLRTSTVHRRLRRWNRERPWFYLTFFRRLRGWVSERGGAAWDYRCCGVGQQTAVWIAICLPSFSLQNKAGAAIGSARLRLCFVFVSVTGQKRSFRTRSGAVPKFFWSFSFKKRTQGFWRRGAARISSLRSRRSLLSRAAKRASSPMRSMAAPSRSFW